MIKKNTFIQQECFKLIKSDSKDYNIVTIFNIDNKTKCFLSSKSAY